MRKNLIPFILGCLLFINFKGNAQTAIFSSNFENWNGNIPYNWVGSKTTLEADSIIDDTVVWHSPAHSCKLVNEEATERVFSTKPLSTSLNIVYYVYFWMRGHGNIRIGLYDGRAGNGFTADHAWMHINSSNWALYSDTITCKNNSTASEFIFDVDSTKADLDHLQIDDVGITDAPVSTNPLLSITYPVENATYYSSSINVHFNVLNFNTGNPGTGNDGHLLYTVDGGPAIIYYSGLPIIPGLLASSGHTITLQLVDNNENPLTPNIADTVHFNIDLTLPNILSIYNIQFTADTSGNSPWLDSLVTTTGIVTAVAAGGYFIQNSTGPWNGIYVSDNLHDAVAGEKITITGSIDEYSKFTEFVNVVGYNVQTIGNILPSATIVTAASEKTEPFEGVLVKINNAACTTLPNANGEWKVYDGDTCYIGSLMFNYTPVIGMHYDITGVVYLSGGRHFIEPRDINDVQVHTGINEYHHDAVIIFPNPANDFLNINNSEGIETIIISNRLGQMVKLIKVSQVNFIIDVRNLQEGLYLIELFNKNGNVETRKFLKEK